MKLPKTADERRAEFMRDLENLLAKHDAEMEITDDGKSYGMHNALVRITMISKYDERSDLTHDFCEFDLKGTYGT